MRNVTQFVLVSLILTSWKKIVPPVCKITIVDLCEICGVFKERKLAAFSGNDTEIMEVDQFAVDLYTGEASRLPLIDESAAFGTQAPKDR